MRWITVTSLVLTGLLVVNAVLITYSQTESVADARTYQYRYRPLQMGTQIQVGYGLCSLGFPAYYEIADYNLRIVTVTYGVITASHCGLRNSSVYQNVTGADNYIGYMEDEGRFSVGATIVNPNDVDATFIRVEQYTYNVGMPRPPPQIVSAYIRDVLERGATIPIGSYISSEQDLWNAYRANTSIYKAGRTTGYERGYVRLCEVNLRSNVACNNSVLGWMFITTAYSAGGDSGGPAYSKYTVAIDRMYVTYANVYGITIATFIPGVRVGQVVSNCITSNGVTMCSPTAFAIVYNITKLKDITPLTIGG